jgi:hypothetical protein
MLKFFSKKTLLIKLIQYKDKFRLNGLIIFILLSFSNVNAQDFWKILPFPEEHSISNLKINANGELFVSAVNNNQQNGLFRSKNEGLSWEMVLNTSNFQIYSFSINPNGNIFVSTGGFYPFRASFDNGATWDTIPIPTFTGIARIEFLGTDTLLLGTETGNGALLLSTNDLGNTWDTLFITENHTSEYVSDIAIAPNGDIYISLMCYFADMGGVYKSTDGGNTWQFLGLLNHQVNEIEVNIQGDIFIGVFSDFDQGAGGVYAIYHNDPQIVECFYGPQINGLTINSAGYIYAGTGWPDGVSISKDNGFSFNYNNSGLPYFPIGKIEKDYSDYIYALLNGPSNLIYRTTNPTVGIGLPKFSNCFTLSVFPNPVTNTLTGQLGAYIFDKPYRFSIFNMWGKETMNGFIHPLNGTFNVEVTCLNNGCYTLVIYLNDCTVHSKLIKNQLT